MTDTIVMRHPGLPKDQEIEVPKDAMPHYTGAGWQQVPAEELEKRAALKAQAQAAAEEEATAEPEDQPDEMEPAEPTTRPARSRRAHDKKAEES